MVNKNAYGIEKFEEAKKNVKQNNENIHWVNIAFNIFTGYITFIRKAKLAKIKMINKDS